MDNNISQLRNELINKTYEFSGYNIFTVYEPKERVIAAPHFRDKVVQLAINDILKLFYNKKFIYDSYACIDNKGTHRCARRINKFMKEAQWKWGNSAYIIKIDIRKFFYTIDRNILKNILRKFIRCDDTLWLIFKIIDSANTLSEYGLPLGNTLSQFCANIYMNEIDQYAKRKLGLKYYVRYADDMVIIVRNKDEAKFIRDLIIKKLKTQLNLEVNESKTKISPIYKGVNTIGYKIWSTHMLLRNISKKRIKKKIKAMPKLMYMRKMSKEKAEQMLNSWKGHAEHCNSYNFINSLKNRFKHIITDEDNILRINVWGTI